MPARRLRSRCGSTSAPVLPGCFGDAGEIGSRAAHDRGERRVLDRERAVRHLALGVPSRLRAAGDDPEVVPVVLRRGRCFADDRLDVAPLEVRSRELRHGRERLVPARRVVHPRLPRMHDHRAPGAARCARVRSTPATRRDAATASRSARAARSRSGSAVNSRAAALTGKRWLGDARRAGSRPVAQTSGPGK